MLIEPNPNQQSKDTMKKTTNFRTLGMISFAAAFIAPAAMAVVTVTSANLTYHLDASAGVTVDGSNNLTGWLEQVHNVSVNIQGTPNLVSTGLGGKPTVRFVDAENDLIYSNNAAIFNVTARTIFVVTTMLADTHSFSDTISDSSGQNNIRQDLENPGYYNSNSGDFHNGGGSFRINGVLGTTVPFGTAHIVESTAASTRNINSIRIGNNANNRRFSGDVSEVLVFDGVLSEVDRNSVGFYLAQKYGITATYVPEPSAAVLLALGGMAMVLRRRKA